jgi:hypothetical protein
VLRRSLVRLDILSYTPIAQIGSARHEPTPQADPQKLSPSRLQ